MRITGLVGRPELNDKIATAVSYHTEKGRYAVEVEGEHVLLKPANLRPMAESGGPLETGASSSTRGTLQQPRAPFCAMCALTLGCGPAPSARVQYRPAHSSVK